MRQVINPSVKDIVPYRIQTSQQHFNLLTSITNDLTDSELIIIQKYKYNFNILKIANDANLYLSFKNKYLLRGGHGRAYHPNYLKL